MAFKMKGFSPFTKQPPKYLQSKVGEGLTSKEMRMYRRATDDLFTKKAKDFDYTPQTVKRRFVEDLKPATKDKYSQDITPQTVEPPEDITPQTVEPPEDITPQAVKGFTPFTKDTKEHTGGEHKGRVSDATAKEKYEAAVKAGTVKPRHFKSFMYKLTGNNKYIIEK